jgi:AcrR family transcriptional regulator
MFNMAETARTEPSSRRERLKREREERILAAAATVFANKGYHRATIREIAELADVGDGTIYNYFDNKFDLLIGILARLAEVDRLPAELMQAAQGDVRAFIVNTFRQRLGRLEQAEAMIKAILPEVFYNPDLRERFYRQYILRLATLFERYIQTQVKLGRVRAVNVPLTVRMVQGMFMGLLIMRILGDEPVRAGWSEVPETLAALVFDGLDPRARA